MVNRRFMFISPAERKYNRLSKIEAHSLVSIWRLSREASTKSLGQQHAKRELILEVVRGSKGMTPRRSFRSLIKVWVCWINSNLNRACHHPNGDTPKRQMDLLMDRLSRSLSIFTQKQAKVMEISTPLKNSFPRPKDKKSSREQLLLEELLKPHLASQQFILVRPTWQKKKSEKYGRNQEHQVLERTKWIRINLTKEFITL